MQHIVKKLRNKSESTRFKIAILVALLITALLATGWVFSLNGKFKEKKEAIPDETQPFSVLKDFFSSSVSSVSDLVKERKASLHKDETPEDINDIDAMIDKLYQEAQSEGE